MFSCPTFSCWQKPEQENVGQENINQRLGGRFLEPSTSAIPPKPCKSCLFPFLADSLNSFYRLIDLLRGVYAPSLVVTRWEVFAEMAATALFAPQRGLGHQLRQADKVLRALVDLLFSHSGELFDRASQFFGAADEAHLAPHN